MVPAPHWLSVDAIIGQFGERGRVSQIQREMDSLATMAVLMERYKVWGPGPRIAAYLVRLRRKRSGSMDNVKSIENAVKSLAPVELAEFRRWFAAFDGAAWDEQIEQDAASGKLDQLAEEALADYRAGSPRQL